MTKYEYTRTLSERVIAIENGATPMINLSKEEWKLLTYKEIVIRELKERKCPLFIYRPIPNYDIDIYEQWSINDLRIPILPQINNFF